MSPAPSTATPWLELLLAQAVRAAARTAAATVPTSAGAGVTGSGLSLLSGSPLKGSIDLSTTRPQTTPPTEDFQTEISTVVRIGAKSFTLSSGGGDSARGGTLQVVDTSDVTAPVLIARQSYRQDPPAIDYLSQAVASYGNLVAVALSPRNYASDNTPDGGRGVVRFYRLAADGSLAFLRDVAVGYLPDSIAFNSAGTRLVIANEGEPTNDYTDRPGSIGIIDIRGRAGSESFSYTDLGFSGITLPAGVRISGPAAASPQDRFKDLEPEYVSILGNFAYVTLQENNAVAKVNIASRRIDRIFALGSVDFSRQLVDISDQDGPVSGSLIRPTLGNNFRGLRMPDGIAAFSVIPRTSVARGKDYFITANEGDARSYGAYSDSVRSGRLNVLRDDPTTAFGSRSVSIFDADTGALVWDSGTTLQSLAIAAGVYDDRRSDDRGVEPEGVVVARVNGRSYAVVGMERATRSMLAVFDVTEPAATSFVTSVVLPASLSPEGLTVLAPGRSPTGRQLLVLSNEVSNTLDTLDLEDLIAVPAAAGAGSFTPTMLRDVAGGAALQISSLLTTGEVTNGLAPGSSVYVAPGIVDGMGAYDNHDGTFTLLVNHELPPDRGYQQTVEGLNAAVSGARISRFIVAKDPDGDPGNGFQPKLLSGGPAYDRVESTAPGFARGALSRFCSANLIEAGRFEGRGFADSLYLMGEESGDGRFFALDPVAGTLHHLPAMGRGGWESATAIDTGHPDTVAVMLFDDTPGSANYLYLWVGRKEPGSADFLARNGLAPANGSLYAWKADAIANTPAGLNGVDLLADVTGGWVKLGSGSEIAALSTAASQRALAEAQGAMSFVRIEDGDTNPANGRQVAFNSTGGSGDDLYGNTNSIDLSGAFGDDGLLRQGSHTVLRVLVDGDRVTGLGPDRIVRSPDNLAWSGNGRLYVQEDKSVNAAQFGSEEASIWEIDPLTGAATRWAQIDRSAIPAAYGQSQTTAARDEVGNWESSGIIDVSAIYGAPAGSLFLADVQAHSLSNGNLNGPGSLVEGGQIVLIQNTGLL